MMRSLALLSTLASICSAHLFMISPVSYGGISYGGNKNGPLCPSGAGQESPTITVYEVGETATFQTRGSHSGGPFNLKLSYSSETYDFSTSLGKADYTQVDLSTPAYVSVTIPSQQCAKCVVQVTGMIQTDGTGIWYNCAYISIVAKGARSGPAVAQVTPATGPTTGGTVVTVTGTQFATTSATTSYCIFENTPVAATWVSSTSITCVTPKMNANKDSVLKVQVGSAVSTGGVIFAFTGDAFLPVVEKISPATGKPGELISVTGKYFFSPVVQCQFTVDGSDSEILSIATRIDDITLKCDAPNATSYNYKFDVIVDSSYSSSTLRFALENENSSYHQKPYLFFIVAIVSFLALF